MRNKIVDHRKFVSKYNTLDTAVKDNAELLNISNSVYNTAIYCYEFIVSNEAKESLRKNNNCVIGNGKILGFDI